MALLTLMCLLLSSAKQTSGYHIHCDADGHFIGHVHSAFHGHNIPPAVLPSQQSFASSESFGAAFVASGVLGVNQHRFLNLRLLQRLKPQGVSPKITGLQRFLASYALLSGLLQLNHKISLVDLLMSRAVSSRAILGFFSLIQIATVVLRL